MLRTLVLSACLLASPSFAEDAVLTIAQDRYQAGASVRFEGPDVTDLFMAGNGWWWPHPLQVRRIWPGDG